MVQYAKGTNVTSNKSREEIERILSRYGADQFMYGWNQENAIVAFRMQERHIKFILPVPSKRQFVKTATGRSRTENQVIKEWEQSIRQRWRALALVIKAKLEAVECGITTFEEEFLAHIQLPDGSTIGDWMLPQIKQVYEKNQMPALLPKFETEVSE